MKRRRGVLPSFCLSQEIDCLTRTIRTSSIKTYLSLDTDYIGSREQITRRSVAYKIELPC